MNKTTKNLLFKVFIPITSALLSGLAVFFLQPDWEESARAKGWIPTSEWQAKARREEWIPKNECPAYPVKLRITSPGNNSLIKLNKLIDKPHLDTVFVITASRSIPETNDVGLIFHKYDDPNYYVIFPRFDKIEKRQIFRKSGFTLPFDITENKKFNVWALVVSNKESFGEHYSDINQIKLSTDDVTISDSIIINLK